MAWACSFLLYAYFQALYCCVLLQRLCASFRLLLLSTYASLSQPSILLLMSIYASLC
uniref:Predicted protein n=1 Tax=Hordeum vulgare subsp. vulgare TaxID=112509 RepID=F2DEF8_HORVV|nr:predicted protein [Hordeum vulgare subsp. vulgare]